VEHGGPTAHRPSILATVGRWLLVAAGLILAFVAYQQWGTAIRHAQAQHSLRSQFDQAAAAVGTARARGAAVAVSYPAVGGPVGVLVIPKIALDQVIVEGVGSAQLAEGPGHYPDTPLPGQPGNAAIAGHRTTHGAPFYSLDRLVPGDPITVTTVQGRFVYRVARSFVVAPDDTVVLAPSTTPELTLTTCNPKYSAAQRLIVVAVLVTPAAPRTPRPDTGTADEVAPDPTRDLATWLVLAAATVGLVALYLGVRVVRRRAAGRWSARVAPWAAAAVGVVVLLVAFGALDALLPASF
jgi:sortase A